MNNDIVPALIASLTGGVVVAILNYFFTRGKTAAEITKLEAETERTRAETQRMILELENLAASVNYKLEEAAERILYDSRKEWDQHHFQSVEGQFFDGSQWKHAGPVGKGKLFVEEGGILNISRDNAEGRFEVWLRHYRYDNEALTLVPKNELIAGKRKLRVSCEAKAIDAKHGLRFVLKDDNTKDWLANEKVEVNRNEWNLINLFFQIEPSADFLLRIDDEVFSAAPSSIQIRNLIIAEKTN